jgi:hypothetical protein
VSRRVVVAVAGALLALVAPAAATADAVDPINMVVTAPAAVRPGAPVAVSVVVNADPGALDPRAGSIHLGVRLAAECGGSYSTTPADVTPIDNVVLNPQPAAGTTYRATARGTAAAPGKNGDLTVCTYLTDDEGRQWATDTDSVVEVNATGTPSGGGGGGSGGGATGGAGDGAGGCTPSVAAAVRTIHHRGARRSLSIRYRACSKGRYRFVLERGARRVRTKAIRITRPGRRTTRLALGWRGLRPGTYRLVAVLPNGRHLRATRSIRITR